MEIRLLLLHASLLLPVCLRADEVDLSRTCAGVAGGECDVSLMFRGVAQRVGRQRKHWVGDGFHVRPSFGQLAFKNQLSPFLMLDYARERFAPTTTKRRGVGQHPHHGFETVTIAFQGEIEHGDSAGNGGVIKPGDVQWMTAGRGIIHEEFHSTEWSKTGGVVEMVQLWVNLPKVHKMVAPRYQGILNESIPKVSLGGRSDGSSVRVIAGEFGGETGPASTWSAINLWDIEIRDGTGDEGEEIVRDIPVDPAHNTLLFVRRGKVVVGGGGDNRGGETIQSEEMVLMKMDGGNRIRVYLPQGTRRAKLLLLSGAPFFDEPIAHAGPFVMNTREELSAARRDYSSGRMGR